MTDPRDLIQRLADELMRWDPTCLFDRGLVSEARAYLTATDEQAEPDGREPTDEELHDLWQEFYCFHHGATSGEVAEIARAVLARWGSR